MEVIKFLTLEKEEISIGYDDAKYIAFESRMVASYMYKKFEGVQGEPRFGGKAIKFAIEYCKKFGKIKHGCSPWSDNPSTDYGYVMSSPEFEMKCKEVAAKAWVDYFIDQIKNDLGIVHELLAVSEYLSAFRLSDLLCQYMFDYLTFKPYGEFREIFGISFLFPPYGSRVNMRSNIYYMFEDILQLPTLEDICEKFNAEFPFTTDELTTAELENKSVRVGENLEYNNEKGLIKEFFIKVECLVRRLNSLRILYSWMENSVSDLLKYFREPNSLYGKVFANKLNNGISELLWAFHELRICNLLVTVNSGILCTNYQDINLMREELNKIDLNIVQAANEYKEKVDKLADSLETKLIVDPDPNVPPMTYFVEDKYHEIYSIIWTKRFWLFPREADYLRKLEKNNHKYATRQNINQHPDVKNEVAVSTKSEVDDKDLNAVKSSLMRLHSLAVIEFSTICHCYLHLQKLTQTLVHFDLLLKDEKTLTFILNEKLVMYKRASGQRTRSKISYAKEFQRIKGKTYRKFGRRDSVIEEAMEKYFLYFEKFYHAMDDETKLQEELFQAEYQKVSGKRKQTTC